MPSYIIDDLDDFDNDLDCLETDLFDFAPGPQPMFFNERTFIDFDSDDVEFHQSLGLLDFDIATPTIENRPVQISPTSVEKKKTGKPVRGARKPCGTAFSKPDAVTVEEDDGASITTDETSSSSSFSKRKESTPTKSSSGREKRKKKLPSVGDDFLFTVPTVPTLKQANLSLSAYRHEVRPLGPGTFSCSASSVDRISISERQQQQLAPEEKLAALVALLKEQSNRASSPLQNSFSSFIKSSPQTVEEKIIAVVKLLKEIHLRREPLQHLASAEVHAAPFTDFGSAGDHVVGSVNGLEHAVNCVEGFLRHILHPGGVKLPHALLQFSAPTCVLTCRGLSSIAAAAADKVRSQNRGAFSLSSVSAPLRGFDLHSGIGQINVAAREFSTSLTELLSIQNFECMRISIDLDRESLVFSPDQLKLSAPFTWSMVHDRENSILLELKFNGLIHCHFGKSKNGIVNFNLSFDSAPFLGMAKSFYQ